MTYGEKAVDFFYNGFNCAQSTAAAFAEDAGLPEETITAMMAGFGGGIGGSRELCGAVTGMVWALGLKGGSYDPHDNAAKTELYAKVREAITEFIDRFGTTSCRELLLKANCIPKPDPSARNAEYYAKRPCAHFVEAAAEIAARRNSSPETKK